jgi:hypothetical protein
MQIFKDPRGQDRRKAQQNFVLGERSLRAYLAGGNVRFLQEAESNFSSLTPRDRRYDDARFYLGITKIQLRKSGESIEILSDLRKRKTAEHRKSTIDLENKIALQLAYAHIKKYTDEGYKAAEEELGRLEAFANRQNDRELLVQTQSIQVFLYSVMAGRLGNEEKSPADFAKRPEFARKALVLGESLLKSVRSSPGTRFEAMNALGITWMRIAEREWDDFGELATSWAKAQQFYDEALTIIPNSVRVLQNLARMRLIQLEHNFPQDGSVLLAQAKEYVLRSLEVNDQDQYPFYELAKIAVEQGDPKTALEYIRVGRSRPGAVKEREWLKVESEAIAIMGSAESGL